MPDFIKQFFRSACNYIFLLLFALGIWLVNGIALLITIPLPKDTARVVIRATIFVLVRFYIGLLQVSGTLIANPKVLELLPHGSGGMLLVANHPTFLDAPILLSRLPGLVCVFKSALKQSLLLPHTAKTAGYLSNDDGIGMLRDLVAKLEEGEHVLLFPEGTRTDVPPLNPLNKGYALAAIRARVPVQLVCIRFDARLLSKQQHILRPIRFPLRFLLEIGPLIEPDEFKTVNQLNRFVEEWFRSKLTQPATGPRRYLPSQVEYASTGTCITATFRVPGFPFYCRGHMPGNPIVPAYVQMAWVHETLRDHTEIALSGIEYTRMKFARAIVPGDVIELTIQFDGSSGRVSILRDSLPVSRGRIRIQSTGGDA